MDIVTTQIQGLAQGVGNDEVCQLLLKATEDAQERSLQLLEQIAQDQEHGGGTGAADLQQMSSDSPF